MAPFLGVERRTIHAVPAGIALADYPPPAAERPAGDPFVVGYLARVSPEKGLHLLVEAFRLLAGAVGRERVRLRVAGYVGPRERAYLAEQEARVAAGGLGGTVEFLGEVDRAGKLAFLAGLDVLSVPTVHPEPKGRFVLEALACGVPVVEPAHGAFPELIAATGGGLLVEPGSPAALADGLRRLHDDPALRRQLGRQGRAAVRQRFHVGVVAEETLKVYRAVLQRAPGGRSPVPVPTVVAG